MSTENRIMQLENQVAALSVNALSDQPAPSYYTSRYSGEQIDNLLTGLSFEIGGSYANLAAIQAAFPTGDTHAYQAQDTGNVYVWNAATGAWESVGQIQGPVGPQGVGVVSVTKTGGTGAPGTSDTYTITLSNGNTSTFQVYNGMDGAGSGDMVRSVYDPQNKYQDIFKYVDDHARNQNMLDNWYFLDPINQRGQTQYTVSGQCSIDRWVPNRLDSVSITPQGIQIVGNQENNENSGIIQYIEMSRIRVKEPITISALVHNSSDVSKTVYVQLFISSNYNNYIGKSVPAHSTELVSHTFTVPDWGINEIPGFNVFVYGTHNIILKAAKAEQSSAQTLARQDADGNWVLNDPPPNKALELLKCQRYYQVFSSSNIRPTNAVDFRPTMRVTPALGTILIGGTTYYTADANF